MLKPKIKKALLQISLLMLMPLTMLALGSDNGETPVSNTLQYIINAVTGVTGISIATLALMSVGIGCLYNKLEWKYFGYTIATIGVIFGAEPIVKAVIKLIK